MKTNNKKTKNTRKILIQPKKQIIKSHHLNCAWNIQKRPYAQNIVFLLFFVIASVPAQLRFRSATWNSAIEMK